MKQDKGSEVGKERKARCAGLPRRIAQRRPPKVRDIQDWKNRASAKLARARLFEQKVKLLTTQQKQALLIRVIVCDDITPRELDELLSVLAASASGLEPNNGAPL
jgi:hypothetical protein